MKDRVWKDCPVCGSKDSMVYKENVTETYKTQSGNVKPFKVTELSGYFCKVCKDGIFTKRSSNKIRAAKAHHMAKYLATVTVWSDLATPDKVAEALGVTRQRVVYMMKDGLISYALHESGVKMPLRSEIERLVKAKKERKKQKVLE